MLAVLVSVPVQRTEWVILELMIWPEGQLVPTGRVTCINRQDICAALCNKYLACSYYLCQGQLLVPLVPEGEFFPTHFWNKLAFFFLWGNISTQISHKARMIFFQVNNKIQSCCDIFLGRVDLSTHLCQSNNPIYFKGVMVVFGPGCNSWRKKKKTYN